MPYFASPGAGGNPPDNPLAGPNARPLAGAIGEGRKNDADDLATFGGDIERLADVAPWAGQLGPAAPARLDRNDPENPFRRPGPTARPTAGPASGPAAGIIPVPRIATAPGLTPAYDGAIRAFQIEHSLDPDGAVLKGGPTDKARMRALAGKPPPANGVHPIRRPVGPGQPNSLVDVAEVQRNLKRLGYFDSLADNDDAGRFTHDTHAAIHAYQARRGLKADGLVAPGGPTEAAIGQQVGRANAALKREFDDLADRLLDAARIGDPAADGVRNTATARTLAGQIVGQPAMLEQTERRAEVQQGNGAAGGVTRSVQARPFDPSRTAPPNTGVDDPPGRWHLAADKAPPPNGTTATARELAERRSKRKGKDVRSREGELIGRAARTGTAAVIVVKDGHYYLLKNLYKTDPKTGKRPWLTAGGKIPYHVTETEMKKVLYLGTNLPTRSPELAAHRRDLRRRIRAKERTHEMLTGTQGRRADYFYSKNPHLLTIQYANGKKYYIKMKNSDNIYLKIPTINSETITPEEAIGLGLHHRWEVIEPPSSVEKPVPPWKVTSRVGRVPRRTSGILELLLFPFELTDYVLKAESWNKRVMLYTPRGQKPKGLIDVRFEKWLLGR